MPTRPLHRRSCTARWTGRPGMLRLSRRLDHAFRVLRYDRRGYGRSVPHPGRSTIDAQVADLVELLDGRRAARVRPQLRRQRRAGDRRAAPGLVAAVARLRDAAVVARLVAGHHCRRRCDRHARATRRSRRAVHAADVGDERGRSCPPRPAPPGGREGPAMVGELVDLRARAVGRRRSTCRSWRCWRARRGPPPPRHRPRAPCSPTAPSLTIDGAGHFGPNTHPRRRGGRRRRPLVTSRLTPEATMSPAAIAAAAADRTNEPPTPTPS